MDSRAVEYEIRLPLHGHPDGSFVVCRAITPGGAGEAVKMLLEHRDKDTAEIIVRVVQITR